MIDFKSIKCDIEDYYKEVNGIKLPIQIFLPKKLEDAKTVLMIHGGAWSHTIKYNNSHWDGGWLANNARYLASKGFIGIVISYRTLQSSNSLSVVDLLGDCIDAIKFIRSHYDFVSFDNIIYMGESAGGYLATMLGLSQDDSIRPKVTVSVNPVLDDLNGKWKYGFKGCDDISSLTPINCIGEKASKFLFIHGTADTVVDLKDTQIMHEKLIQKGKYSKLMPVEKASHAFMLFDYKNTDENIIPIMNRIIDFINELQ